MPFYQNLHTITINIKYEYSYLQTLYREGIRGDCCSNCLKELKSVVMAQRWLRSEEVLENMNEGEGRKKLKVV